MTFYESSFVFAAPSHELSWHKILFSSKNWSQFFYEGGLWKKILLKISQLSQENTR